MLTAEDQDAFDAAKPASLHTLTVLSSLRPDLKKLIVLPQVCPWDSMMPLRGLP